MDAAEQTKQRCEELEALAAEIESVLASSLEDDSITFETLPEQTALYVKKLESLISSLGNPPSEGALYDFLQVAHQSINRWTKKAIEARDETRHTLLKLSKGKKARAQY